MTKLRNIGYLRFGSKILQGFTGFFTSLTPPLSLSPLWISWAENEGVEGRGGVLYLRREPAAPPAGRQAPCHQLVGRQGACRSAGGAACSLQGPLRKINLFLFTYRSLVPPCRAVGPLPPPYRAVGV